MHRLSPHAVRHPPTIHHEIGGKSPACVDSTTDLPAAARRIAWAKLVNAGQTCVAPDYLLAPPEVAEELAPLLSQEMVRMYGTDAAQSPDFGRIITTEHAERLQRLVSHSVEAGEIGRASCRERVASAVGAGAAEQK